MPLTPEGVSNKRFTAVRLREGYDMTEVDQFLDEVEAELARLYRENDELRAKLGIVGPQSDAEQDSAEPTGRAETSQPTERTDPTEDGDGSGATALTSLSKPDESAAAAPAAAVAPDREQIDADAATGEAARVAEPAREPRVERIEVSTTAEASAAATRLLELAGRNADELVEDARAQAENILSAAQAEAAQVSQEARTRSEQLDSETAARREQLFG